MELVYIVLKSITSFSQTDACGVQDTLEDELSSAARVTANRTSGIVITTLKDQEPIQEIDMDATQQEFDRQTNDECGKKRTQVLQQIEIRMVDDRAKQGIQEFMYEGFDGNAGRNLDYDPLEQAFNHNDTNSDSASSAAGSGLRKMSQQVKSIISEAKHALNMDSVEESNTMTINEEVQVIEWAPAVFHAIKKMDGITPQMIETSLSTDANFKQLFKAKESAGKSGSFMFSSADKRFLIKTMNKSEQRVLVKALPRYLDHLRKNRKTLIARIYGIYTVKMEDISQVHILLMGNLFEHVSEKISEFDLKGSIINREVHQPFTMKDCLKDVNLQEISKDMKFLRFQRADMRRICEQILSDITFMAQHNLMDYSLLLITEENPRFLKLARDLRKKASFKSVPN